MRILIALAALATITIGSIMPASATTCYQHCTQFGNTSNCSVTCY